MASVGGWVTWASRVVGGGGGGLGAGRGAVIGSLVTMVEMEEKLVVCRQLRSAENKVGLGAGGLERTSWHQLHVFNNASSQVQNSEIMNISVQKYPALAINGKSPILSLSRCKCLFSSLGLPPTTQAPTHTNTIPFTTIIILDNLLFLILFVFILFQERLTPSKI